MSASRRLSWALRHGAGELGLPMDAAGWVELSVVAEALELPQSAICEVVEHNNKSRLQLTGSRIRACQGHSLAGMPVTLEALEGSWSLWPGERPLWHGTVPRALQGIAAKGLLAGKRTHVHLAPAIDSVVGKRTGAPVMLEVDPTAVRAAGLSIFEAPNGVVLARHVPRGAIVGLKTMSRKASRREAELRAALGLCTR